MDISKIVSTLQELTYEMSTLQNENSEINVDEFGELTKIANTYPISNHFLTTKDDAIRMTYIAGLIALVNAINDNKARKHQILLIHRIIAAYDEKINFGKYTAKSLKVDEDYWDDLADLFDYETRFFFSIDMLSIGILSANRLSDNKYENISDVLQILKFSNETINRIALLSKSIVEQDFASMINQINETDKVNYNHLIGYFRDIIYTAVESDFSKAQSLFDIGLIVNATISNNEEIIDLDKMNNVKELHFYNCKFLHIKGIKSTNKKVFFENCIFETNLYDEKVKMKENNPFISGENIIFEKNEFLNCKSDISILKLNKCKLVKCKFKYCHGVNLPNSTQYAFDFTSCRVSECNFLNCGAYTDNQSRSTTLCSLIYINKSSMSDCVFETCYAKGYTNYGRFAKFNINLIRAIYSKVSECNFKNCSVERGNYSISDASEENYIIAMTNSTEHNNIFDEKCNARHCNMGNRTNLNYYIGNIKEN